MRRLSVIGLIWLALVILFWLWIPPWWLAVVLVTGWGLLCVVRLTND